MSFGQMDDEIPGIDKRKEKAEGNRVPQPQEEMVVSDKSVDNSTPLPSASKFKKERDK
jgi:hypothetical protein